MIVARKRPHEPWELVDIENTLEAPQAEVGGQGDEFCDVPITNLRILPK